MFNREEIREALRWIVILVVVFAIGAVIVLGVATFRKHTADYRGSAAATEKVQGNGAYRIAAYDSFYNQCAAIQGKEATLTALRDELKTGPDPDRVTQIRASITAVTASRGQAIADYNASAAKTATAGQFRDSHLPYSINASEENTTCAVR